MHFFALLQALLMQIIFLEAAATQTQFLYLDLCARLSVFFLEGQLHAFLNLKGPSGQIRED
jgi:hypothetical protein